MRFSFIVLLSLYIKLWFSSSKSVWQEGLICNTLLIKTVKSISYIKAFIYSLTPFLFQWRMCKTVDSAMLRESNDDGAIEKNDTTEHRNISVALSHHRYRSIASSRYRFFLPSHHRHYIVAPSHHNFIVIASLLSLCDMALFGFHTGSFRESICIMFLL